MPVRIPWDKYEIVLLVFGYYLIKDNSISKKVVISMISKLLRNKAINIGIEIDDKYRNYNGIAMQLSNFEYVDTDGIRGLNSVNSNFRKVYEVYHTNRSEFDDILKDVRTMVLPKPHMSLHDNILIMLKEDGLNYIDNTSKQGCLWVIGDHGLADLLSKYELLGVSFKYKVDGGNSTHGESSWWTKDTLNSTLHETNLFISFSEWLKGHISEDIDKYLSALNEIHTYALSAYMCDIYVDEIDNILNVITQIFRDGSFNDDIHQSVIRKFRKFLKSAVNEPTGDTNTDFVVDFNKENSLEYSEVTGITIFGEKYDVHSWRSLYLTFAKAIFPEHSDVFYDFLHKNLGKRGGRMDISDDMHKKEMFVPKHVADNIYIEVNLSAKGIVDKIKYLMDYCSISYENVKITYVKNSNAKKVYRNKKIDDESVQITLDMEDVELPSEYKKYYKVALDVFPNGMRINSKISENKYKKAFFEKYGYEIEDINSTNRILKEIGFEYSEKIYFFDRPYLDRIKCLLVDLINNGCNMIYYENFYKINLDLCSQMNISTYELLVPIFKRFVPNLVYKKKYVVTSDSVDIESVIVKAFNDDIMLTTTELSERLPYVDSDSINEKCYRSEKLLRIDEGAYALVSSINISFSDVEESKSKIETLITAKGFATLSDIVINKSIVNNSGIPERSLQIQLFRDYLSDMYSKTNNIISRFGENITTVKVIDDFISKCDYTTIDELEEYEISMTGGSSHYLWEAFNKMIRINENTFIAKNKLDFDVDRTDDAIGAFVDERIISINDITSFTGFPYVEGVEWNHHLLKSYIYHYSKKYKTLGGPAKKQSVGAIYSVGRSFDNYDELLARVAADYGIELNDKALGEFFKDHGYVSRATSYSNVASMAQNMKMMEE